MPELGTLPGTPRIDWTGQAPLAEGSERTSFRQVSGRRTVPAPDPWQAGWNTFIRNLFPPSRFWVDPSPTGEGGKAGMVLGGTPYGIGALLQGITAGSAAGKKQGQMVPIQSTTGWDRIRDLLATVAFGAGLSPVGAGVKMGTAALSGLAGAPGFFNTSWEQMAAGAGGMAIRELADRTGILRGGGFSPPPSPEPVAPRNPFQTESGFIPSWAGGPSTWNQPSWTWELPNRPIEAP